MKSTSKHIPMRTCAACRKVKPKRELVRLVCAENGAVEVDTKGKKNGRGAYLCPSRECWEKGLKHGQLDRVLRITLIPENKAQLLEQGNNY
ncbi:MAG: YlxR family protein [Dehalococcoidales bacterium]|nr:YlxR family protein [Dehalococcoidales bacterium]